MLRPNDAYALSYPELKGLLLQGSTEPETLQSLWTAAHVEARSSSGERGFLWEYAARYMVDFENAHDLFERAAAEYDAAAEVAGYPFFERAVVARDAMAVLVGRPRARTLQAEAGMEAQLRRFQREGNPARVRADVEASRDPSEQLEILAAAVCSPRFVTTDRIEFAEKAYELALKAPTSQEPINAVVETVRALAGVDGRWHTHLASVTGPAPTGRPVDAKVPVRSTPARLMRDAAGTRTLPGRGLV